jgi:hypothetical protein
MISVHGTPRLVTRSDPLPLQSRGARPAGHGDAIGGVSHLERALPHPPRLALPSTSEEEEARHISHRERVISTIKKPPTQLTVHVRARWTPTVEKREEGTAVEIDGITYADGFTQVTTVTDLRALTRHRLWLRFSGGDERVMDLTPFLSSPAFLSLRDDAFFAQVTLDHGVPRWAANDIDLDPEWLLRASVPASGEDPGIPTELSA